MAESGRVPPLLRLCRGCRHFVRREHDDCPFCGGNLDAFQRDYEERVAEMYAAEAELRAAWARHQAEDAAAGEGKAA